MNYRTRRLLQCCFYDYTINSSSRYSKRNFRRINSTGTFQDLMLPFGLIIYALSF